MKKEKTKIKYSIISILFLGLFLQISASEAAEIYFEWDGESGYQYLGQQNAHPGGGYFSYMGGSVAAPEGVNPCDGDMSNYHYTILSNEAVGQGSVLGSNFSLKTPYSGNCPDESYTRDSTNISLSENKREVYVRWYQKFTGNWMDGSVQHKLTKFHPLGDSRDQVSTGYFTFRPNSTNLSQAKINNVGDQFSVDRPRASVCAIFSTQAGAGSQYDGVNRYWDNYNNALGLGGEDEEFYFETDIWYSVEIHVKLNSNGETADAELDLWVDGEKVTQLRSFRFYDGNIFENIPGIGQFEFQNIYYNRSATDQPTYMDNIVISDSYIGPIESSDTTPPSAPSGLNVS